MIVNSDPLVQASTLEQLNLGSSRWALAHGFRPANRTLARAG